MPIRNHIENYLRQLFEKVQKERELDFFSALIPIDNKRDSEHALIPYGFKDEMAELNAFITQYQGLESSFHNNPRALTRNRLLTYTHILEADFIYLVLLNLILLLLKKPICWTFYDIDANGSIKINKKGEKIYCSKPLLRIKILECLGDKLSLKVHNIFSALWKNELRNAFSHSQYFIGQNGDFILTKHLLHDIKVKNWKPELMLVDSASIFELNENAIMLFDKFISLYQEFTLPFKSTGTHKVKGYLVKWDLERQWWTFDYSK